VVLKRTALVSAFNLHNGNHLNVIMQLYIFFTVGVNHYTITVFNSAICQITGESYAGKFAIDKLPWPVGTSASYHVPITFTYD